MKKAEKIYEHIQKSSPINKRKNTLLHTNATWIFDVQLLPSTNLLKRMYLHQSMRAKLALLFHRNTASLEMNHNVLFTSVFSTLLVLVFIVCAVAGVIDVTKKTELGRD